MSQPWSRQQSGFGDMELWQQRLMYRQLQERQRQQQLQQLDQEARQQNSSNEFSGIAKQVVADQLPLVVNGMPIHDVSTHTWKIENMGSEQRVSSAKMFPVGNVNWEQCRGTMPVHGFPNGLGFLQNQGHALRSMGLFQQQPDQSFYGTPVSSGRHILNQYSQFPVAPYGISDTVAKPDGNQAEKQLMQSGIFNSFQSEQHVLPGKVCPQDGLASRQISPGKTLFGHIPAQHISSGITLENVPQLNSLGRSRQVQELQGRQEQTKWSKLQEIAVPQLGPSEGISALDPTEQRLLFGTDDESPCIESSERVDNIGLRGYLDGNFPEGNDYFNAFPSLQSGSWSALMQSAVAEASSSDGGLPDERRGSTPQQKEPSSSKHLTMIFDSGKQQIAWVENFQSASSSTSKPLPTSDNADAKNDTAATFCQPYVRSAHDHGQRLDAEASTSYQLDQSQLHQRFLKSIVQSQMHSGSMSGGTRVQTYEQPLSTGPVKSKLHHHGLYGTWANQQKVPLCNGSQLHDMANTWNASELTSPAQHAMLKADDQEKVVQNSSMNFPTEEVHMRRYQEINVWKNDGAQMSVPFSLSTGGFSSGSRSSGIGSSQVQTGDHCMSGSIGISLDNSNKEANEISVSGHEADHGKLLSANSSMESRGNEDAVKHKLQVKKDQVVWRPSVNIFERASSVDYGKEMDNSSQKEVSDGDHISDNSHPAQLNDSGGRRRQNCLLAQSDSSQSASGSKMPSCQIGQKSSDSRRCHFLPMGNLDVDVELPTSKRNFYSQGQSQMVMSGTKSQTEPELIGQSQFRGHSASISQRDMDKHQLLDSQRDVNALEEVHCGGRSSIYDSDIPSLFKGSTANLAQNKSGQGHKTSQNMLELPPKVEQSRNGKNVSLSGFPNHNMVAEKPDKATCDMPSYLQHYQPSALQEVGLGLPLKHQSTSHHALPSQAVQHYNSRHFELEAGGKNRTCVTSSVSIHPLSPLQVSERENMETKCSLSGLPNKETSPLHVQMLSPAMSTSRLFYAGNQLQQQLPQQLQKQQLLHQQVLVASGCDQSIGILCGSELDQDAHSKNLLHTRESNDLHGGAIHVEDTCVAEQSGEQLLLGVGQTPPFKVASLDGLPPVMSYPCPNNPGQPQVMGAASFPISTGQLPHLPVLEKQLVSRPSATSVISQQGAFSAMRQNVWTNLSQQHLSGSMPANIRPSLFQPVSVGAMDMNYPAMQRPDDQGRQTTSMFATCSIISEQPTYEEKDASKFSSLQQNSPQEVDMASHTSSAPLVQESISEHVSDGNSSASIVPMVQLHQQEIGGLKLGKRSSFDKQTSRSSLLSIASSSHHLAALGHSFKSPDVQNQNYPLLRQLQAMKSVESDSSKLYDKRLKGDSVAYPQLEAEKMSQSFNRMSNGLCPMTGHQSSFPSDTKMLHFSLEANGNQNIVRGSQLIGSDFCSQDLTVPGLNSPQSYSSSLGKISMPPSVGVIQSKQMDHQVAPSWFEQYEKFKNGQNLAKAAVQDCFLSRASESMRLPSSVTQGNDSSQIISFWHSSSTATANEQSSSVHYTPADDIDHTVVPRPNKRKTSLSRLIPWHKEITRGSDRLWNISMAELDWAHATKRLCSKVEDEDKTSVDGLSVPRARRRLVLTTQLMQQLVPALPLRILAADATFEYESMTYLIARLVLRDACGRISCSRSNLHFPYVGRNTISEKLMITKGAGEHFFSEVTEGFIGRMSKLENDLSRSEKGASFLDIRVECQDLERFSIINRFANFHGRGQGCQADVVENSSTSEAASWKMFLQRYATALSMPGNLAEGMICLSL
ncbi:hypothetical protein Taro_021042 [Colocasia esculenta]|uniref:Uncharacterized protein n=1 Tax=Colocasia esculenta TaxID=4460 RepID=A0A843V0C0_COLES|nr:hypothetical protein [Colocasia esculenta]